MQSDICSAAHGARRHAGWLVSTVVVMLACGADPASQGRVASTRGGRLVVATAGQCTGTGAHDRHAAASVSCQVCHPCGGAVGFSDFTYPRGTTTAGGTITLGTGTTPTTCAVACHNPMGTPAHSIAWNTPGPLDCTSCHAISALPAVHPALAPDATRAQCLGCHDQTSHTSGTVQLVGHPASWMNTADAGFHAFSANQGLGACQACHKPDLSGGFTGFSCAQCHDGNLPAGVASWRVHCVMCHGATDNTTGAPPRATWGQGADLVRVGAHTTHVAGSPIAPAFDCTVCHLKPADALSPGHVDGPTATVLFSGLGANRGDPPAAWDRPSATCSNTYCHGATIGGGTNKTPLWTAVGQGQAACGTCHGVPPPPPHPAVSGGLGTCSVCHSKTIDPGGVIIPPSAGGLHLDGLVEAAGHEASWMDTTSTGFHAYSADRGLGSCQACHGVDLAGGSTGVACAQCHGGGWQQRCTMCHGGVDNVTGAPPRTIWGQSGDPIRVGAHTRHVGGSTDAAPIGCESCHVTPADAFAPAHLDDAVATVTWGGRAVLGGAAPSWDRATASCAATYCHGSYQGSFTYFSWEEEKTYDYVGRRATAVWTDGPMTCGSCHDNPPRGSNWHSGFHGGGNQCQLCHPDATGTTAGVGTGITNPTLHVNGVVEVAPQWKGSCFNCH